MYTKDKTKQKYFTADAENHRNDCESKKLLKVQISHVWPLFFDKWPQLQGLVELYFIQW